MKSRWRAEQCAKKTLSVFKPRCGAGRKNRYERARSLLALLFFLSAFTTAFLPITLHLSPRYAGQNANFETAGFLSLPLRSPEPEHITPGKLLDGSFFQALSSKPQLRPHDARGNPEPRALRERSDPSPFWWGAAEYPLWTRSSRLSARSALSHSFLQVSPGEWVPHPRACSGKRLYLGSLRSALYFCGDMNQMSQRAA